VTVTARSKAPELPTFERHWQDEADAAFVYRVLADVGDPLKQRTLAVTIQMSGRVGRESAIKRQRTVEILKTHGPGEST